MKNKRSQEESESASDKRPIAEPVAKAVHDFFFGKMDKQFDWRPNLNWHTTFQKTADPFTARSTSKR